MIAVNQKKIEVTEKPQDGESEYAKRIRDGIKEIERRFKFPLQINYPEKFAMRVIDHAGNAVKKPEWPGGKKVSYKETIEGKFTSEEWQYYERSHVVDGEMTFSPLNIIFNGHLSITRKDADLAFFLLYISPHCQNSLTETIRTGGSEKYFIVEDKKQEAFEHINKDKEKMKVEYLIKTADEEEAQITENELRDKAMGYGIEGTEGMSVYEVQEALIMRLDYIFKGGNKEVYNDFLKESENKELVSLKAKIGSAFEKNIIGIKPVGAGNKWCYRDKDGFTKEITKINPKNKLQPERITELANFFLKDEEAKTYFLETIQ